MTSTLIALIASALLAGAAVHALLVGAGPGWVRGALLQIAFAAIALVATIGPMFGPEAVTAMLVPSAKATTIGNMASSITGSFAALTKLITAACYLAGLGFVIAAVTKFKQWKDNPAQAPLPPRMAHAVMTIAGMLGMYFNSIDVQALIAGASGAA